MSTIKTSVSEDESKKLVELARGKTVLEIGSWLGYSAMLMAPVAEHVFTIDWHLGDKFTGFQNTREAFFKNIEPMRFKITALVGNTKHILPMLKESYFDFVFVDGDHSYESANYDVGYAYAVSRDRTGVIAVHDYGKYLGVTQAVDNRKDEFNIEVFDTLAVMKLKP